MATQIAALNVKLQATTGSFWSAMTKATKPVEAFGSSVLGATSKIASFAAPLAALAMGGGLLAFAGATFAAVDAQADLADKLGISTQKLIGLQHAAKYAGSDAETLNGSLQKMMVNLDGAASGGGSNPFAKLGLDAKALASMSPDQAFYAIADGFSKVDNASQRAALAQDIFGKSGSSLVQMLSGGTAGLAAMQAEAERLGLTFSRLDAEKVAQAKDSLDRVTDTLTGGMQTAVIQLAPYIQGLADMFTEMATSGGGLGPKVVAGIEYLAQGIAYAADVLTVFKAGFYALKTGIAAVCWFGIKQIQALAVPLLTLIGLIPGMGSACDSAKAFIQGFADGVKDEMMTAAGQTATAWNDALDGKNSKAVTKFFGEIKDKSTAAATAAVANVPKMKGAFEDMGAGLVKVTETLDKLKKELATFGQTDSQKQLGELKALGAGPDQLKQAEDTLAKLDALNAAKKQADEMQSKAKSIFDETRTPMEKYTTQIDELSGLLNGGAIDWDTYGRAVRAARVDLEGTAKAPDLKAPELIAAGTAQAIRFAYDQASGSRTLRDDMPKQTLLVAKDQRDYLETIARNTQGISGGAGYAVVTIP